MPLENSAHDCDRSLQIACRYLAGEYIAQKASLIIAERDSIQNFRERVDGIIDGHYQVAGEVGHRCATKILQVDVDDWEGVLVASVSIGLRDLQIIEPCVPLVSDVEECIQHRDVGRLPESPRPCEQVDPTVIHIQNIFDQETFVDVILVVVPDSLERQTSCVHLFHDDKKTLATI